MIPLLVALIAVVPAQEADQDWLFVGNSYTARNGLADWTALWLAQSLPLEGDVAAIAVTTGGYTLPEHLADADGSRGDTPLQTALVTAPAPWTAVVLQDQSQIPGFPQTEPVWQDSRDAAAALALLAGDTGAEPWLYQTWGRRDGDPQNAALYPDFETMQDRLIEGYDAYRAAAEDAGQPTWIAPVGEVFAALHASDPALFAELYADDGSHPSLAGTSVAAATFTAAWSGRRPVVPPELVGQGLDTARSDAILAAIDAVVLDRPARDYPWAHALEDWQGIVVDGTDRRPLVISATDHARDELAVRDGRLWLASGRLALGELVFEEEAGFDWSGGTLAAPRVTGDLEIPDDGVLELVAGTVVEGSVSGSGTLRWDGPIPGCADEILRTEDLDASSLTLDLPAGTELEIDELRILVHGTGDCPGGPDPGYSDRCGCAAPPGAPSPWIALVPLLLLRRERLR